MSHNTLQKVDSGSTTFESNQSQRQLLKNPAPIAGKHSSVVNMSFSSIELGADVVDLDDVQFVQHLSASAPSTMSPLTISKTSQIQSSSLHSPNTLIPRVSRIVILDKLTTTCLYDRISSNWKGEKTHNGICALIQFFNQFARSIEKTDGVGFVRFEKPPVVSRPAYNGLIKAPTRKTGQVDEGMEMVLYTGTVICAIFYDKGLDRISMKKISAQIGEAFERTFPLIKPSASPPASPSRPFQNDDEFENIRARLLSLSKSEPFNLAEEAKIMKLFELFDMSYFLKEIENVNVNTVD